MKNMNDGNENGLWVAYKSYLFRFIWRTHNIFRKFTGSQIGGGGGVRSRRGPTDKMFSNFRVFLDILAKSYVWHYYCVK